MCVCGGGGYRVLQSTSEWMSLRQKMSTIFLVHLSGGIDLFTPNCLLYRQLSKCFRIVCVVNLVQITVELNLITVLKCGRTSFYRRWGEIMIFLDSLTQMCISFPNLLSFEQCSEKTVIKIRVSILLEFLQTKCDLSNHTHCRFLWTKWNYLILCKKFQCKNGTNKFLEVVHV